MAREQKARIVEDLTDKLARASFVALTDFRGLNVADMESVRRRLREAGVEYRVAKNTLIRFAAQRVGRDAMVPQLVGPTALALGYGDPVDAAKALREALRAMRTLSVRGAVLDNRLLSPEEVNRLAELPSREVLLAQLVGGVQGPLVGLVSTLSGVLQQFVGVLEARRLQLEGQGAGGS